MHRTLYRAATTLARHAPLPHTARASMIGRAGAAGRWETWAGRAGRSTTVWFHGASVGECLALDPVMARLRVHHREIQSVLTYVSPSAATWQAWPVQHADYLPLDRPDDVRRTLDAIDPALIAISRSDIWPELMLQAASRGVPLALVGATIGAGSARLRWPARALYRDALTGIRFAGAVTPEDAERLVRLGVPPETIAVTGDPAHDRVLERVPDLGVIAELVAWRTGRHVAVIGSLEPDDIEPVRRALRIMLREDPQFAALLVPHDARRIAASAFADLDPATWRPGDPAPAARVTWVATRGLLTDLYALADVAYVGGAMRRPRPHSLLEPAAFGVPAAVGGAAERDAGARAMIERGGAACARDGTGLAGQWARWLVHPDALESAGLGARRTLRPGAAAATVKAINTLLGRG